MTTEPDYVNEPIEAEWYTGGIPDEWRCQYVFEHSHEYEGRDVKGRRCGLLAFHDLEEDQADRCVFHRGLPAPRWHDPLSRSDDTWLAHALRRASVRRAYMGEANLFEAPLQSARLGLYANLQYANLNDAQLQGAGLARPKLQGASLRWADLHGADLSMAALRGADLLGARIEVLLARDGDNMLSRAPSLRGANLTDALLTRISLAPEADLEGAEIDCPIRDELCARDDETWEEAKRQHGGSRPTFAECESTYRQLKLNFQESGDYQRAGEFYLRERECERAQAKQEPVQPCPWDVREALILFGALLLDVLTGPTGIFLIPAALVIAGYYLWKIYGRRLTLGLM